MSQMIWATNIKTRNNSILCLAWVRSRAGGFAVFDTTLLALSCAIMIGVLFCMTSRNLVILMIGVLFCMTSSNLVIQNNTPIIIMPRGVAAGGIR